MSAALEHPLLNIRSMTEADIDHVIDIEIMGYDFPWTTAIFTDCLRVGYQCVVVTKDHRIVGYAVFSMAAGEAHLLNICIDPDHRGSGCASYLMSHVMLTTSAEGCRDIFLEVRPSNESALSLYRRFGFRAVGKRPKYYRALGGREDALVLTTALNIDNSAIFGSIPASDSQLKH